LTLAADMFAERGFANVSVDDLGDAAGVSGPALYHHFAGKEALLGEMLIGVSEALLDGAKALAEDPTNLVRRLIDAHCTFALTKQSLITVHFRDLISATTADQHRVRRLQSRYIAIWVEALRTDYPNLTAPTAKAAVQATFGLINSTPYSGKGIPRDHMADLLAQLALAALHEVGTSAS
jgi:AcrR family transcriptional regulator